jgi:methylmalonyl-CoA/ethylmalonyl-CoA epimerase
MSRLLGVDHIAIAVHDLDQATEQWKSRLDLRVGQREIVADQGVEVQMMYAGDTRIELVRPLHEDSPIHKFLERKGEGLHHLALAVDDCQEAVDRCEGDGAQMIDRKPRGGAHGTNIAFCHPKSTNGVLLELVQGGEGPWNSPQPGDVPTSASDDSGNSNSPQ